ncbi:MAG: FAD-dependent oxidoreductase [Victivallaceae bacterium]
MDYLSEPSKKIPIAGTYDVIVAGGGPSGIGAAVAAARNGVKTLLIEGTGALGGMGTNGLVPAFCPTSFGKVGPLIKGFAMEVIELLEAEDGVGGGGINEWIAIDAEKLKFVYDEIVAESGVTPLFFTLVSDVIVKDREIEAVIVENKSGRQAYTAKTFIDCTGDADLAFRAGVPCRKGDENGAMQATSLCLVVAGIKPESFEKWCEGHYYCLNQMRHLIVEGRASGELKETEQAEFKLMTAMYRPAGVLGLNFGHIYDIDGTMAEDLTVAMITGRKLAHDFIEYLRKRVPGMENAEIVNTGSLLGVRETRRIIGKFVLEEDAFFESKRFNDDIAVYNNPIDVHESNKASSLKNENPYGSLQDKADKIAYGIPFSAMIPQELDNLLVAGRSISADRSMQGTTRVMTPCLAMGQACGTAAALVKDAGIPVSQVNIAELRKKLMAQGANIAD